MKGAVKNAINCKLISRIKGAPRRSLVAHPSTISFLFFFSWIRTKRGRVGSLSAVKTAAARFSLVGPSIFSVFFKLRFYLNALSGYRRDKTFSQTFSDISPSDERIKTCLSTLGIEKELVQVMKQSLLIYTFHSVLMELGLIWSQRLGS